MTNNNQASNPSHVGEGVAAGPGQHNLRRWGLDIHWPVFPLSAGMVLVFVAGVLLFPDAAQSAFGGLKQWTLDRFDWLYMLDGNLFVLFCLGLAVSPWGGIRLGGGDCAPDYTRSSWFAMLFAAGMGIGLMYWGVAEPLGYYTGQAGTPLGVAANTPEATRLALGATLFHWGLHPWAIYAVVGLALAYFSFNRGMPLTIRSAFHPLLGDRIWGVPGHIVDVLAVLATMFGLATSLGLGAMQAAAGFGYVFGWDSGIGLQLGIVVFAGTIAGLSVVVGIERGMRVLSNTNMVMALALLGFIMIFGPTREIFRDIGITASSYLQNMLPLANWIGREDRDWMRGWTVFYWAWWTSWAPFVGMFIAQISRGRTVRELIVAVLLVPAIVTLVWMSTFGGTAIHQVSRGVGELVTGTASVDLALFRMLGELPLTAISSLVGIALVLIFFMTSSNSGSIVIDTITAGGKEDAPVIQRAFWAALQCIVAAVLLFVGGTEALTALQAMTLVVAVPFSLLLLAMCVALVVGLRQEPRTGR